MARIKLKQSRLGRKVYDHLVLPFVESSAPISHISRGAAVGIFVALTPTMGVQMYVVGMIWLVLRSALRFHFNLPIAVALVWISNPFTMIPLYYGFLLTGDLVLGADLVHTINFEEFRRIFMEAERDPATSMAQALLTSFMLLFWEFGWPMVVGSLFWATPLAVAAYPITTIAMLKYRHIISQREGQTYRQWKKEHVRLD